MMSDHNAKRIAMWSGPRNISTAMMRSFENRRDTIVVDEPLYAAFLQETGIDHPGRDDILKAQSTDWRRVAKELLVPLPDGVDIFYQKHMCHHLLDDMGRDWINDLTNVFLIRDPRAMIASYVKSRETVCLADIGVAQQLELFKRTADRLGSAPPVLDSADVLKNPAAMLNKLCASVDIPFDQAMLTWPAGSRDSDGIWAPYWYDSVIKSTGFSPYREGEIILSAALEKIADKAQVVYEELFKFKINC